MGAKTNNQKKNGKSEEDYKPNRETKICIIFHTCACVNFGQKFK